MSRRSSALSAASASYLEALYRQYRTGPDGLDESWRCLFGVLDQVGEANNTDMLAGLAAQGAEAGRDGAMAELLRSRGHLFAQLNPLAFNGSPITDGMAPHLPPPASQDMVAHYLGPLAIETAHIDDAGLRNWLIEAWEHGRGAASPSRRIAALHDLLRADEFERFMARKFPGKKRFGAEGAEAIVPLLRQVLHSAAAAGVTHVVIGTMHRGRLNVVTNVAGRPLARLLAEMKGAHPFPADPARPGDVPYHLGHHGKVDTGTSVLDLVLLANPSHLEAIDPVVLGRARAMQDAMGPGGAARVLPVVIHTDAAVIGQGVVAETLQLAAVPGFATGGTVHLVVNNGIGFTTEAHEARTSTHCTGAWKAVDSCILHANGDDADAVSRAAALAVEWRQTHARDAVIDLVCYRRNGHNEIDEPTFTQPLLYQAVAKQTPAAEAAAQRMIGEGVVSAQAVRTFTEEYRAELEAAYTASQSVRWNESGYPTQDMRRAPAGTPTGIDLNRLHAAMRTLAQAPGGIMLHPKMARLLPQRDPGDDGIAWPVAESLAFGTLLQDGVSVRLTGQDVVRGAFSHRHYDLVDTATGAHHTALAAFAAGGATVQIHNSPLSEYAVLGFEYGYSLECPNALTMWEAQFGDFANGAQIILDQFLAAAEEKWCSPSGLVVLLPHGLEGQGPEHSSARLERFLQMAADGNMRIINPSTPANYFHALRRQVLATSRKPLIVMGAKRLLRLPAAVSPTDAFGPDRAFEPVLVDAPRLAVHRILMCSGKIAYDLLAERARRGDGDTAIVRLEELYPFPAAALHEMSARWPDAPCIWVQEEPRNMGAYAWLDRRVEQVRREAGAALPTMGYVGRAEAGSPAGSFHGAHDDEQARIVADAFGAQL